MKIGKRAALTSLSLILTACGGGAGSSTTLPPADIPAKASQADAARYLEQGGFGATESAIQSVQQLGVAATIDSQLITPATGYPGYYYVDPNSKNTCPSGAAPTCYRDNYTLFPLQNQFFRNALTGSDQLRQRVAFALSQIFVVSGTDVNQPYAMAAFQQLLLDDSFGSYRQLLEDVSLSPAMGDYLNMVNNDKANAARGTSPNENYAREVLQLFSIGLMQLNADGTIKTDSQSPPQPITTYDQDLVESYANIFTGWTYPVRPGATSKWTNPRNYQGRMEANADHHDSTAKTIFFGQVLPAGQDAATDLKQGLDAIANHPNIAPFIGKQLIQFLVTANPSPAYVGRVSAVFTDDGKGQRGNLGAVVKAILLDPDARGDAKTDASFGRLREPVAALVGPLRGIGGSSASDGVYLRSQSIAMGENIYQSPSVFNFYPPNYPLAGGNLVGPTFAIYDSTTAVNRANFINAVLARNIAADSSVAGSTGTSLDLTAWKTAAADANTIADKINLIFFHGAMSTAVRNTLVQTVNGIPASDPSSRARAALYLALTSHGYQVQQ